MKQNFLDKIDGGWDNIIDDIYTDVNEGFEITYHFKSPQTFNEATIPSDTLKISGIVEDIKTIEYRNLSVTLQLLINNIMLGDIKLDIPENEYLITLVVEYHDIKIRKDLRLYNFHYNIIKATADRLYNLELLFIDRKNLDPIYRTHYVTFNDALINKIVNAINSIDISYYKPDIKAEKQQQKDEIIKYLENYR